MNSLNDNGNQNDEYETSHEVDQTLDTLAKTFIVEPADNVNNATLEQKQGVAFENLRKKRLDKLASVISENKEIMQNDDILGKLASQLEPVLREKIMAEINNRESAKIAQNYVLEIAKGDKDIADLITETANKLKPTGDLKKDIDFAFTILKAEAGISSKKETINPTASQNNVKNESFFSDPILKGAYDAAYSSKNEQKITY